MIITISASRGSFIVLSRMMFVMIVVFVTVLFSLWFRGILVVTLPLVEAFGIRSCLVFLLMATAVLSLGD
jgi:hypothetical protein